MLAAIAAMVYESPPKDTANLIVSSKLLPSKKVMIAGGTLP